MARVPRVADGRAILLDLSDVDTHQMLPIPSRSDKPFRNYSQNVKTHVITWHVAHAADWHGFPFRF